MEPARTIVKRLGGPKAISGLVGVHRTRVSNWMRPRAVGGTGGAIPQKYHRQLLECAAEKGIDLSAEDFLLPASDHKQVA